MREPGTSHTHSCVCGRLFECSRRHSVKEAVLCPECDAFANPDEITEKTEKRQEEIRDAEEKDWMDFWGIT